MKTLKAIDMCDRSNADLVTALHNTWDYVDAILGTKILHDCGFGRAFSDNHLQTKENYCSVHEDGATLNWYYTNTNPLPSCIRKK